MDTELFELCKEVYQATGWKLDAKGLYIEKCFYEYHDKVQDKPVDRYKILEEQFVCPLYTSDYLLEKLPYEIQTEDEWGDTVTGTFGLWKSSRQFTCGYIDGENGFLQMQTIEDGDKYYTDAEWNSDTPLKALLKLTLALHEAGELQNTKETTDE